MTSGQMESPLWKKLQNEQTLKYQQQLFSQLMINNTSNEGNMNSSNSQQMNLNQIQNMADLNQLFMASNLSTSSISPPPSVANGGGNGTRDYGIVEKILNNYGFIKHLSKDNHRLFFYYSFPLQSELQLKMGDIVEYEETIDKRNGKPLAINLSKQGGNANQQQQQSVIGAGISSSEQAIMMLLKTQSGMGNGGAVSPAQLYNQHEQQYHSLINGLKMQQQHHQMQQTNELSRNNNVNNNLNSLLDLINNKATANVGGSGSRHMQPQQTSNRFGSDENLGKDNLISNEYMEGIVVNLALRRPNANTFNGGTNGVLPSNLNPPALDGRITYQQNGETFYIPYSHSDILTSLANPAPALQPGDRVKFNVAVNNYGIYYACRIESLMPQQPTVKQLYRGIITSLKDTFGKIEREDLLKETFFHVCDYRGACPSEELRLGLNVEFEIQDRYGKEIANNITRLPDGTVCFDELSASVYIGRIIQAPIRLTNGSMTLGRLLFDNNQESLVELTFSEGDRVLTSSVEYTNKYTLMEGDFVQFRIATDKRKRFQTQTNNIQRAAQVTLIEEHSLAQNFMNTGEQRERGILIKVSELVNSQQQQQKYGAIKCLEREDLVYFAFGEVINYARFKADEAKSYVVSQVKLDVGDSLEFSVKPCQHDQIFLNGMKAIRVRQLARNSVQFEMVSSEVYTGYVDKEAIYTSPNSSEVASPNCIDSLSASSSSSSVSISEANCGFVRYDSIGKNGLVQTKKIAFSYQNQQQQEQQDHTSGSGEKKTKTLFYYGDKVQFNILTCARASMPNRHTAYAVNIKTVEQRRELGLITILKESYGFIELNCVSNVPPANSKINSLPRDIFFHFSSVQGSSSSELEVGDEVEFLINRKSKQKLCAENVCKQPVGTIFPTSVPLAAVLKGKVVQTLRGNSQQQQEQKPEDNYFGKIAVLSGGSSEQISGEVYPFGLFSLSDKKSALQSGDIVSFQLIDCVDGLSGSAGSLSRRAFNVQLVQAANPSADLDAKKEQRSRELKKGKVENIKGHCGYIEYTLNNETKKVFFHISDLAEQTTSQTGQISDLSSLIKPGDEVEFQLSHNSRSGKLSAIKVKRLTSSASALGLSSSSNSNSSNQLHTVASASELDKRPERLNIKLKAANIDEKSGKELVLIRQPNNPDESNKGKSFTRVLQEREPGTLKADLKPTSSSNQLVTLNINNSSTSTGGSSNNYQENANQLSQTPTPPACSIFDLLLASNNSFQH